MGLPNECCHHLAACMPRLLLLHERTVAGCRQSWQSSWQVSLCVLRKACSSRRKGKRERTHLLPSLLCPVLGLCAGFACREGVAGKGCEEGQQWVGGRQTVHSKELHETCTMAWSCAACDCRSRRPTPPWHGAAQACGCRSRCPSPSPLTHAVARLGGLLLGGVPGPGRLVARLAGGLT